MLKDKDILKITVKKYKLMRYSDVARLIRIYDFYSCEIFDIKIIIDHLVAYDNFGTAK